MVNTFEIVGKGHKAPVQQNIDGQIVRRKVGRPKKEGQGKYGIRLPKELHRQVMAYCERHGYRFSQLIQWLLAERMNKDKSTT